MYAQAHMDIIQIPAESHVYQMRSELQYTTPFPGTSNVPRNVAMRQQGRARKKKTGSKRKHGLHATKCIQHM